MNSNQLLDALKAHTGAASDNALARKVLKVDPTAVRDMRERGLSDAKAVQIATLLGLNQGEVLAAVHAERAKDPEVRKAWERLVKTVRSAAAGLFVVLGIAAGTPEPARAAVTTSPAIHSANYRMRRLLAVLGGLLALSGPVSAGDWQPTAHVETFSTRDTTHTTAGLGLAYIEGRHRVSVAAGAALGEYDREPVAGSVAYTYRIGPVEVGAAGRYVAQWSGNPECTTVSSEVVPTPVVPYPTPGTVSPSVLTLTSCHADAGEAQATAGLLIAASIGPHSRAALTVNRDNYAFSLTFDF